MAQREGRDNQEEANWGKRDINFEGFLYVDANFKPEWTNYRAFPPNVEELDFLAAAVPATVRDRGVDT